MCQNCVFFSGFSETERGSKEISLYTAVVLSILDKQYCHRIKKYFLGQIIEPNQRNQFNKCMCLCGLSSTHQS